MKIIKHSNNLKPLNLEVFNFDKKSQNDKLPLIEENAEIFFEEVIEHSDVEKEVLDEEIPAEVIKEPEKVDIHQNISQVRDIAYQEGFDAAKLIFEKDIESLNLEFEKKIEFYKKICDEIESTKKNQQFYIENALAKFLDTLTLIASKFKIQVNFQEEIKTNCLDLFKNGYNNITVYYNFDEEINLGQKINLIKDERLEIQSYKIKFEDSSIDVSFSKIELEINNIIQKLNERKEKVNP